MSLVLALFVRKVQTYLEIGSDRWLHLDALATLYGWKKKSGTKKIVLKIGLGLKTGLKTTF